MQQLKDLRNHQNVNAIAPPHPHPRSPDLWHSISENLTEQHMKEGSKYQPPEHKVADGAIALPATPPISSRPIAQESPIKPAEDTGKFRFRRIYATVVTSSIYR